MSMRLLARQYRVARLTYALLSFSACPATVDAQTPKPGERDAAGRDSIIITALKRDEPLARAAAPVSVLTGSDLREGGITSTDRLSAGFPALTVQPTSTGNLIFVRGVGNFTLQPNSDPAVGFVYDGVPVSRPMGTLSQFFDLDRIELLKGPQGVLYGRNASAGSINLEPRQPVIGERSMSANLEASDSGELRSEAALNLPLGRAAALRVSGALSHEDALLDGYRTGPRQASVRGQVKTSIGRVTARLSGDYNRTGGVGIGTSYVGKYSFDPASGDYRFSASGLPLSTGIYTPEAQAFRQTIFLPSAGRNLDAIGSSPWQDNQFYGVHARIDAETGLGQLSVIPAWRKASLDAVVSGPPFGLRQREGNEQESIEARLAGSSARLDWLVGTFLFKDSIRSDTMTNLSSVLAQSTQHYGTSSQALFGNLTVHLNGRLRVGGGARWSRDRKDYASDGATLAIVCQRQVGGRPSCPATPLFPLVDNFAEIPFPTPIAGGAPLPILAGGAPTGAIVARSDLGADGRLVDHAVTWRVSAELDLAPGSLLYATAETGARPGGFNTAVGFETYDPERITAYTLGLRHRGLGGKLRLALEAFWWDYRDQQVSSLRPDLSNPPRNANITENIGNSRIRGIEADVRLRPRRSLELRAVLQYLDARYRSFRYVFANTGAPPLTGCPASLDAASNLYTVDCTAMQPYNSPRWSMNLNLRDSFTLGRATLTAVAETQFQSARNIGFAFLPEQHVGPTWTSNAQLIVSLPASRLELAAFVRNIEGERVPEFMIYHPVSNALVAGTSPPRQIGLRASLRL
jgi:iron complex outermembrane receptor protein